MLRWLLLLFAALAARPVSAQTSLEPLAARPVVRPVPTADRRWSKAVWRRADLRARPNRPLFAPGYELGQLLLGAVRAGELTPYRSDSLTTVLPLAAVEANLRHEPVIDSCGVVRDAFSWRDVALLDVREALVFDQRHSRMVHEYTALTLLVPADRAPDGLERAVATFRYADVVAWCRAHPQEAIWRHPALTDSADQRKRPLNLSVTFDRALYYATIRKLSNPDDLTLTDLARGDVRRERLLAQDAAQYLIDLETGLWAR